MRNMADLAPGDAVLVQSEGKLCFKPVSTIERSLSPSLCLSLPSGSLGNSMPLKDLMVVEGQRVGMTVANSNLVQIEPLAGKLATSNDDEWFSIIVQSAECIIVEGVALEASSPGAVPACSGSSQASAICDTQLHAFIDNIELNVNNINYESGVYAIQFTIPAKSCMVELRSRVARTATDHRYLGVAILSVLLSGKALGFNDANFARGFHACETTDTQAWRWTNGDGLLLIPSTNVDQNLLVRITDWHERLSI